jgi:hypothetical protein
MRLRAMPGAIKVEFTKTHEENVRLALRTSSATPATDLLGPDIRVRISCLSGNITWRSTVLDHAGGVLTVME